MYKTTVTPDKGEPFEADIDYTIWSEVFTCPHCGSEVVFYDAAFNPKTGRVRDEFPCPTAEPTLTKRPLETTEGQGSDACWRHRRTHRDAAGRDPLAHRAR